MKNDTNDIIGNNNKRNEILFNVDNKSCNRFI